MLNKILTLKRLWSSVVKGKIRLFSSWLSEKSNKIKYISSLNFYRNFFFILLKIFCVLITLMCSIQHLVFHSLSGLHLWEGRRNRNARLHRTNIEKKIIYYIVYNIRVLFCKLMKSHTTWRFKQGRMTLSNTFDCKSIMKKRNFMNLLTWEEFVEFSGVEDYEKMEYLTSTWPVPKETKTRITNYLERLKRVRSSKESLNYF